MRTIFLLFFCSVLLSAGLSAQKPVVAQSFERPLNVHDLRTEVRGNERIDLDTGFPVAIYNPATLVSAATPEAMAFEYLGNNLGRFGLTATDLDNLQMHFLRQRPHASTVRLRQHFEGVEVHGGEISISIAANQQVCFVTNDWQYDVTVSTVAPQLDAQTARDIAANYIDLRSEAGYEENSLVIIPYEDGYRLAYRVVIEATQPLGGWNIFVDATDGIVLYAENTSCFYHDHKAAIAPPVHLQLLVNGTAKVFDTDPLATANADYNDPGYSDNNDNNSPQLLAEQQTVDLLDITFDGTNYQLIGPWAEIQDFESPNRGLFSQPSPNWTGDREDNSFEAANVYYHVDASMRYLNVTLGLNIRPSLYTSGVRFDPSGLNNADNSHYLGGSERISFGDGGVDDAEDSDVIHHELGHGLHDWVTGGSLSQNQGLSEGSGDYWAVSYNRSLGFWNETDDPYNWVFRWDGHNEFWSGRRVNLAGTYPDNLSGGIHNQGQMWATSMMLVWDAIGKEKTDRIFWEGLGLTGGNSNQNDAANAAYQAANNLNYSNADRLEIHTILTNQGYTLPDFVLPVTWVSIEAMPTRTGNLIRWKTADEVNHDYFQLERSVDGGRSFSALSREGFATSLANTYEFLDTRPVAGENIYRVRQVDYDNAFSFSPLVNVDNHHQTNWQIGPNPTNAELYLSGSFSGGVEIVIYDLSGRKMLEKKLDNQSDIGTRINVSVLRPGVYSLVIDVNGTLETKRFVVE